MLAAVLAAVLAVMLAAGACPARDGAATADAWQGELEAWRWPAPLPAFPLLDDQGRSFTPRDLTGPTLLAFAFSRCAVPEACLKTTARLRDVAAAANPPRILVVTLDPKFDQPAVLAAWKARERLDGAVFATGATEVMGALASTVNVFAIGQAPELNHPVKAVLLVDGTPRHIWPDNDFTPDDVRKVIHGAGAGAEVSP